MVSRRPVITLDAALHHLERMLGVKLDWGELADFLPADYQGLLRRSAIASSFVAVALVAVARARRRTEGEGAAHDSDEEGAAARAEGTRALPHSRAHARGRRPGFPVAVTHVIALVVSFKLAGAFDYAADKLGLTYGVTAELKPNGAQIFTQHP